MTLLKNMARIKQLTEENVHLRLQIEGLLTSVEKFSTQNKIYEDKYVNTNLECEFCYTTLQAEFKYCPICGRKIEKKKESDNIPMKTQLFETEQDRDGLLITQYNGFSEKSIRIPSTINGTPVIGIWNNVFEECTELEEVYFDEGCKYLGKDAFNGCVKLRKIHLPKSLLEIGDGAFAHCSFSEIAIPPNVKVIGARAFIYSKLKEVLLPPNLKYISYSTFSGTDIEKIDIPQSVVHICDYAFKDTKIKEIELPYNLYSIGSGAFATSTLKKITIHSNVKIICDQIFGCEDRFKKDNRANTPTILCAAGSKAHMYARKYGIECKEIAAQPVADVEVCASWIVFAERCSKGDILQIYRYLGLNKAESWSWKKCSYNAVNIDKTMDMNEALRLVNKIKKYYDCQNYDNWSAPFSNCPLKEVSASTYWGKSIV